MKPKSFRNSPVLAYISGLHEFAHEVAHEAAHEVAHEVAHEERGTHTVETAYARVYVRTQGRKGHKKPRLNVALDSEEILDEIRVRAERDDMSVTQFVNLAIARYLDRFR